MSDITSALNLPPELAIRFFKQKINVPTEKWDDLWNEQHTKGFMVAGAMKADLLQDFRNAVNAGIEAGESLDQFRGRFDQIVERHGWDYHGTKNWRSQVIFDTNVRTAYAAGRWQQMTDPEVLVNRPYLQYRHGDSVRPRPLHLSWDKKILPATSPWWEEHYPPGGYGCKCKVYSLSKRDLLRKGKNGPDQAPDDGEYEVQDRRTGDMVKVPRGIDPGFAYNPGKDPGKAGRVLGNLLDRLDPDLRKQLIADLGSNIGSTAKTRKKIIKDLVAELPEETPVVIPKKRFIDDHDVTDQDGFDKLLKSMQSEYPEYFRRSGEVAKGYYYTERGYISAKGDRDVPFMSARSLKNEINIIDKDFAINKTNLTGSLPVEEFEGYRNGKRYVRKWPKSGEYGTTGEYFNPQKDFKAGIEALKKKEDLTFAQEYALESFFHELLHTTAQKYDYIGPKVNMQTMELFNQYAARSKYPDFLKQITGGTANPKYQADVFRNGYGYGTGLRNFQHIIDTLGINHSDLANDAFRIATQVDHVKMRSEWTNLLLKKTKQKEINGVKITKSRLDRLIKGAAQKSDYKFFDHMYMDVFPKEVEP